MSLEDRLNDIDLEIQIAEQALLISNYPKAEYHVSKAIDELVNFSDKTYYPLKYLYELSYAHSVEGTIHFFKNDYTQAKQSLRKVKEIQPLVDQEIEEFLVSHYGQVSHHSLFDRALDTGDELLTKMIKLKYEYNNWYGQVLEKTGNIEEAHSHYWSASEYLHKYIAWTRDVEKMTSLGIELSLLQLRRRRYKLAERTLEKTEENARLHNFPEKLQRRAEYVRELIEKRENPPLPIGANHDQYRN